MNSTKKFEYKGESKIKNYYLDSNFSVDFNQDLSEIGKKTDIVWFLLHGYGSSAKDMIGLTSYIKSFSKYIKHNILFVAPNAPRVCGDFPDSGFEWAPIKNRPYIEKELNKDLEIGVRDLEIFTNDLLNNLKLNYNNLVMSGFSQGGMLSLQFGLYAKNKCAKVISFCGGLIGETSAIKLNLRSKPDLFLFHGSSDEIVNINYLHKSIEKLENLGVDFKYYIAPRVGHHICDDFIVKAIEFIG